MAAIFSKDILLSCFLIEAFAYIGNQGLIPIGSLMISIIHFLIHLIIVHAEGFQLLAALLISPGGIQNRYCSIGTNTLTQQCCVLQEAFPGSDWTIAHLLENYIVPLLILQSRLRHSSHLSVRIQLLGKTRSTAGVLNHFSIY